MTNANDVKQATWRYDYDEESKMYTVWWLLPGAKAALGSDWLHVADVYTEAYAKMIIADHQAAARVPALEKDNATLRTLLREGVHWRRVSPVEYDQRVDAALSLTPAGGTP